jgi:hypothetical protein
VTQTELLQILTPFTAERLALLQRHEAGAQVVSHYDFNNTYQYVINREETHIAWLRAALTEIGAAMPAPGAELTVPTVGKKSKKIEPSMFRAVLEDDARQLKAFADRWRDKVEDMSNARHKIMLNVILGETVEHARLFDQAAAGFEDLLGRRTGGVARQGGVLPTRWVE